MKNFTLKYSFQKILLLNSLLVFALFGLLPKLSYASSAIAVGSNIFSSTRVGTHLYVNNAGSNTVSVIDTATNAVVDTIVVGSFPISSTLVGSDLYVNNESSGTVSVIDTGSNTVINTISAGVGNHPFSSTLVGSDLYVNNFLSNDISVIDTNSANLSYNTVTTTISILPETHPNTSTLIGSDLYVNDEGSNSVSVIDTNSLNVTHTIPVGSSPESFTATGSDLYVNNAGADTVSVIDMGTYSVVATIPVGSSPLFSILVGSDLYVNNDGDSSISIIDTGSNTVINTISAGVGRNHPFSSTLVGSDLYVDNTSSNNVSVIDVNSADTSYNTVIKNIDVQNNPRSSTLVGTDLYVNNNSSNNVSVIDTSTNTIVIVSPPSLLTEEINGTTLTMTFDESLDTSSIPDVGDFTVDVNNNPVTILSVNVVGTTVVLTLTNPVIYSDNVNVTYTVGSNPIQDLGGFQAISFSTNTSNSTPAPTASNVLVSGIPNVGEQLTGTYDYSDANGDLQGVSTFQWHRNGALIDGATTDKYTLTRDDSGTTIIFDVTPVSQSNVSGYSADSNGTLINSFPSISPYIDKYDFNGTDAGNPSGSLIQGPNDPISGDEELYGMAPNGGINGPGVIFRYDPIANTFTDLHDFDGNDGGYPAGSLIQGPNDPISGDTELYGMAYEGGQFGWGVIFQYDVTTGVYTVKYNFNLPSGGYPSSSLVQGPNDPISGDTEFYGTASQGGAIGNNGVIFQYDLTSNTYTDEHNFNGTDGSYPSGSLSLGPDGKFYGMTQSGGINGSGNIFQFFIPIYITGTPAVSQTLTGHYAYFDAENDLEGASIFQWYRNGTPISGATTTTYSLTVADAGTVITFGVTPVALTGSTPGNEVQSIGLSISSSSIPSTPVITENKVSGSGIVYGCKDPAALNYNSFSSNKPSLCQYANNTASNTQTITTSPASSFSFTRILKYSMTGADVKTLQIYLNTHGYPVATVGVGSLNHETTYFGLKTKGAVIKFQKANKLIPDGIVGPKTRALIK